MRKEREERGARRRIATYFGLGYLALYLAIPSGGLASLPLLFLLKDRLHLSPEAVSGFKLLMSAPAYISFVFGMVRDRWSPFGWGDRGYLLLFGGLATAAYAAIAVGEPNATRILIGMLVATTAYRFLSASLQGLTAAIGKDHAITGRLSSIINGIVQGLAALSTFAGGWMADHFRSGQTYALLAGLTAIFLLLSLWGPSAVFGMRSTGLSEKRSLSLLADVKATLSYRPLWPSIAIWLLWQFVPGFGTAFAFYFSDGLKGDATALGTFFGIFAIANLPMVALYAALAKRFPIGKLLIGGLLLAVPQMVPLLLIRDASSALWLAVPIGLMGGFASATIYDLILRSTPPGLEGTGTMLADAGMFVAIRFGDLLGAKIYATMGFAMTAYVTTGVYALMLPLLLLVPRGLLATRDRRAEELAAA